MSAAKRTGASLAAERELVITRVFDAPRELVFRAWTEPEHIIHWWGPNGFTTPHCTVDFRPGGVMHYCMRSPEGKDYWGRSVFQEIVKPNRLVYLYSFSDADGNVVEPQAIEGMDPEFKRECLVTVTFAAQGKQTLVTLCQGVPLAVGKRSGMQQGWTEMLERLADYLTQI